MSYVCVKEMVIFAIVFAWHIYFVLAGVIVLCEALAHI